MITGLRCQFSLKADESDLNRNIISKYLFSRLFFFYPLKIKINAVHPVLVWTHIARVQFRRFSTFLKLLQLYELNQTPHKADECFLPHSNSGGNQKHCAIKLLPATALLFHSCCSSVLLTATCSSLILFCISPSFLPW